jgi:hypothetical protein
MGSSPFSDIGDRLRSLISTPKEEERFWLEEPRHLLRQWTLVPSPDMTNNMRLNALTRLVLVVSLVLLLAGVRQWWLFLLMGLLLLILAWGYQLEEGQKRDYFHCLPPASSVPAPKEQNNRLAFLRLTPKNR